MKKSFGSQTSLRESVSQTHPCILDPESVEAALGDVRRVTNDAIVKPIEVEAIILQNDLMSLSQSIYTAISTNDYSDLKHLFRRECALKRKYALLVLSHHSGNDEKVRLHRIYAECKEWDEKRESRMYRARDAAVSKMTRNTSEQAKAYTRVVARQNAEIVDLESQMRDLGREYMSVDISLSSDSLCGSAPVPTEATVIATLADLSSPDPMDHVDADWVKCWEILEKASNL